MGYDSMTDQTLRFDCGAAALRPPCGCHSTRRFAFRSLPRP